MTAPASLPLRVLVVANNEPWPLNGGGPLRLHNFLRGLATRAKVTLALPRPPRYAEHMPAGLRLESVDDGAAHLRSRTAVPGVMRWVRRHFGHSPALAAWLEANARPERFDAALLYGAVTGEYIDALRIPVVWDPADDLVLYFIRDAARHAMRGWPSALRAAVVSAVFERYVARRARATVFCSTVDASYARRWVGGARVETIAGGVDFDYFSGPTQAPESGTVAFIGSLSFPPNVDGIVRFATRVWPRVRRAAAACRLLVVGRQPAEAVQRLAALPGVELHADVPDVRPYLSRAAVVVVPTRLGGGLKNKVLEACAMRRPVVASPRALAGLSARRGRDVLCATDEAVWVRQVARLLACEGAARFIGASGQDWVRRTHRWPVQAARLHALLAEVACR
jgi:glycosyltransferase involved in cell wall biosynthesis